MDNKVVESRGIRYAGHVTYQGDMNTVSIENPEGKKAQT